MAAGRDLPGTAVAPASREAVVVPVLPGTAVAPASRGMVVAPVSLGSVVALASQGMVVAPLSPSTGVVPVLRATVVALVSRGMVAAPASREVGRDSGVAAVRPQQHMAAWNNFESPVPPRSLTTARAPLCGVRGDRYAIFDECGPARV
jgi:hypothetical protein